MLGNLELPMLGDLEPPLGLIDPGGSGRCIKGGLTMALVAVAVAGGGRPRSFQSAHPRSRLGIRTRHGGPGPARGTANANLDVTEPLLAGLLPCQLLRHGLVLDYSLGRLLFAAAATALPLECLELHVLSTAAR